MMVETNNEYYSEIAGVSGVKSDNYYLHRINENFGGTNNKIKNNNRLLHEISENIGDVKSDLVDNLEAMGVEVSDTETIPELVGEILNIEPSISVETIKFATELSLTVSSDTVAKGSSITLSASLTGGFDDTSSTNIDLSDGIVQGATVLFKVGNTTVATAVTDVTGVASTSYTPYSDCTITAVFESTRNFEGCNSSSVSVTVTQAVDSILLMSDKSILSYVDEDTCSLTATCLDAFSEVVEGATVTFKAGSTTLGTAVTDDRGIATMTYTSAGVGDISLTAEVGMIVSEVFVVEDCSYYHESAFTSTQSDFNVSLPSNFELSFITKRTSSSSNSSYIEIGGNSGNTALIGQVGGSGNTDCRIYASEGSSSYTSHTNNATPMNEDALHIWTHNGSNNTYSMNSNEVTFTDGTTHSKIRKLSITNNQIAQLKVKPL